MYETLYDKLQPYFGQERLQLQYWDTDSFVLGLNTKDIIKDLRNLNELIDLGNLSKNQELIIIKNEGVVQKFNIETPEKNWVEEFVCLKSKMQLSLEMILKKTEAF